MGKFCIKFGLLQNSEEHKIEIPLYLLVADDEDTCSIINSDDNPIEPETIGQGNSEGRSHI